MGTTSNLSELTVTCSQCGSASMERLGPREYRCNHCGAITVVSQDPQALPYRPAPASNTSASTSTVYPGPVLSPTAKAATYQAGKVAGKLSLRGWILLIFFGVMVGGALLSLGLSGSSSSESAKEPTRPAPTVPIKQLALAPAAWITDPTSSVSSGKYVSMLYNHSPWPIEVPRYSMTLYTDGIKGASATSEAPLARLLPGEYEPVSFAFETPHGSTRTEIAPPESVERADGNSVALPLTQAQLVREEGKPEYRLVGLVQNNGKSAVKTAQVLVMLFGTDRTLVGYGTGYARAMRPGEQTAVDVHIPTASVQPVLRYEYLVDAAAEDE